MDKLKPFVYVCKACAEAENCSSDVVVCKVETFAPMPTTCDTFCPISGEQCEWELVQDENTRPGVVLTEEERNCLIDILHNVSVFYPSKASQCEPIIAKLREAK